MAFIKWKEPFKVEVALIIIVTVQEFIYNSHIGSMYIVTRDLGHFLYELPLL